MTVMQEVRDCLPLSVKCKFLKVKGHQCGDPEDLPFEARLNDAADQMAEQIRAQWNGPINQYLPYTTEGLIICDDQQIKI